MIGKEIADIIWPIVKILIPVLALMFALYKLKVWYDSGIIAKRVVDDIARTTERRKRVQKQIKAKTNKMVDGYRKRRAAMRKLRNKRS